MLSPHCCVHLSLAITWARRNGKQSRIFQGTLMTVTIRKGPARWKGSLLYPLLLVLPFIPHWNIDPQSTHANHSYLFLPLVDFSSPPRIISPCSWLSSSSVFKSSVLFSLFVLTGIVKSTAYLKFCSTLAVIRLLYKDVEIPLSCQNHRRDNRNPQTCRGTSLKPSFNVQPSAPRTWSLQSGYFTVTGKQTPLDKPLLQTTTEPLHSQKQRILHMLFPLAVTPLQLR